MWVLMITISLWLAVTVEIALLALLNCLAAALCINQLAQLDDSAP